MKTPTPNLALVVGAILGLPVGGSLGYYLLIHGGPFVFGSDIVALHWLFAMFRVPGGMILGGWTIAKRWIGRCPGP